MVVFRCLGGEKAAAEKTEKAVPDKLEKRMQSQES